MSLLSSPADTNRNFSQFSRPNMPIPDTAKNTNNKQALTPALRELVEACFTLQTTSTKVLAAYLQRSPAAIRTDFQRIRMILGKHSKHPF